MEINEETLKNLLSFSFGDSPKLADELLNLVLAGKKRATCGALRDYEQSGAPAMPRVGREDIVLDGNGQRSCIIRTTSVELVPFNEVTEDFAVAEGEGTFEEWKTAHIAYFGRNGGFHPEMMLVCERFEVVHIFACSAPV